MSEKLCFQWNNFKENTLSAFGCLRDESDFADVTLACEDGKQMEVHKVILATSSPFFQNILKRNKHTHPLIYLRGVKYEDLSAIVDFLYCGEANVYQQNLDSFLAIAGELKLKGLMGKTDEKEVIQKEKYKIPKELYKEKTSLKKEPRTSDSPQSNVSEQLLRDNRNVFNGTGPGELQDLLQESESMIEKTERKMPNGKILYKCKVCGKESEKGGVRNHIETKHMEGISIPCKFCEKTFRSRNLLSGHNLRIHKDEIKS